MNDEQSLDKTRTRRRLDDEIMNKEAQSTYALLMRSEEKGRNIMETALYALVSLSAIVSIWQFAYQPNPLPIDGMTPEPHRVSHVLHQPVEVDLDSKS